MLDPIINVKQLKKQLDVAQKSIISKTEKKYVISEVKFDECKRYLIKKEYVNYGQHSLIVHKCQCASMTMANRAAPWNELLGNTINSF